MLIYFSMVSPLPLTQIRNRKSPNPEAMKMSFDMLKGKCTKTAANIEGVAGHKK